MNPPLTVLAVHAHPDDEVTTTGGVLALSHDQGLRTVVVTCTGGEMGDGPGGVKPGEPGHDPAAVAAARKAELEESCRILGVDHLEMLGYLDSGMDGWAGNADPLAFANVPVADAAARLVPILERYQPQVVVTYDENGGYGHPDHIQAHRVAVAAAQATRIPAKFYYGAIPRSAFARWAAMRAELIAADPDAFGGAQGEGPDPERFGTADEDISARVDCTSVVGRKWDAMRAHASQTDSIMFLRLGAERFAQAMNWESFVRAYDRTGAPLPESDLFAGLR